jgi:hypothetical protein
MNGDPRSTEIGSLSGDSQTEKETGEQQEHIAKRRQRKMTREYGK